MGDSSEDHTVVGGLFGMLMLLAGVAVVFVIILVAVGDNSYAAAAGVLFGMLMLLAATDSMLARHQARHGTGADGVDGPIPVMAVDLRDPLSVAGDLPEADDTH
jgi:hypothetical protein